MRISQIVRASQEPNFEWIAPELAQEYKKAADLERNGGVEEEEEDDDQETDERPLG